MKKIAMLMVATMTIVALTACGGSKTPEASPSTETSADTATSEEAPAADATSEEAPAESAAS